MSVLDPWKWEGQPSEHDARMLFKTDAVVADAVIIFGSSDDSPTQDLNRYRYQILQRDLDRLAALVSVMKGKGR